MPTGWQPTLIGASRERRLVDLTCASWNRVSGLAAPDWGRQRVGRPSVQCADLALVRAQSSHGCTDAARRAGSRAAVHAAAPSSATTETSVVRSCGAVRNRKLMMMRVTTGTVVAQARLLGTPRWKVEPRRGNVSSPVGGLGRRWLCEYCRCACCRLPSLHGLDWRSPTRSRFS
jgi:hypothetical protein